MDGIEESRRLQELYAHLTDDELLALSDDGDELTDVAKLALQSEILGRGLHPQMKQAQAAPATPERNDDFDPSDLDLVVAQRVYDQNSAREAKLILNNARIPSYLGPENFEDVGEFQSSFEKGVDLKVRAVDRPYAMQALSQMPATAPEEQKAYLAVCPQCHSPEIVLESLDSAGNANSAPDAEYQWSCDACGFQWRDDGIEQEA
jgi:hypothetical protein